ncbi:YjzD family protein [Staphylococcus saprophyticus]|uniref:YjzD family protein n=1 Tax=Staphylococcus saprophyticus TaxID=29385 RepID=UPI002DB92D32|nr:YjzD family protein [Staphylococcus saprophyticus]MEB7675891.1 YjzD family protein [Staphylococcus saprophyticus]
MKYLAVLFWSIVLLQMINFVLNSLNGGGALNLITPFIGAVVFTIIIILFDLVIKPKHNNTNEQH